MTIDGPAAAAKARERDSPAPVLVSVNVGLPKDVPWQGKSVHTGVWKYPVRGTAMVRRLNIDGDGQGDLAGHGGEQRAVLVYQLDSYQHWAQHFGRNDFSYGQFGENLTVDGLPDDEVCIGDRYRIGAAEFEVTQPRVTCYRVGLRLGEPELPALLVSHHRPGFYMRVITEGHIQVGDAIVKTRTGPHSLSVADTDAMLYLPGRDPGKLRAALQIPALSPGWQGSFRDLAAAPEGNGTASTPSLGARPGWPAFRELRVAEVVRQSATVSSIYLAAADGTALPAARAGQYLTLRITGAGQPAPVRSYSLSSAPDAGTYRISVKQEPHGIASNYLNHDLRPGAILEVAAPRGDFVLDDGAGPVLLISAGIGLTPVLSMLHQLAESHSERDIWWVYGARGPHEHPFAAEAHALLASLPHARPRGTPGTQLGRLPPTASRPRMPGPRVSGFRCPPRRWQNPPRGTMPEIPADLRYSKDHLWARPGVGAALVRVGVTDFAQQSLGDVVDVTLPETGDTVTAGQACGDIESVKSLSDPVAPVAGTVRARNDALADTPELVNTDPYGQGWMFEVETDPATLAQQLAALMDADAYRALAGA